MASAFAEYGRRGNFMKSYTWHKLYGIDVAVDDETGKIHHAIASGLTCYPYAPAPKKYGGGYENVCGCYTLKQARGMIKRRTLLFF